LLWVFTRAFHAEYNIVAPGRTIRVLVFKSKGERKAVPNDILLIVPTIAILVHEQLCRLHDKDKRLSVGIIDCILTKGLSTISEGIPKG
jgi:hypothetical protein